MTVNRAVRQVAASAAAVALLVGSAHALEVKFQPVADGVFAYIGDTGPRSAENEGLNANIGLVITSAGAVLIDSGATYRSARQIHEAVKKVTLQPVKWVINTGGQDHRWLGNGYFKEQGAEIIAHADAKTDMQSRGGDHLAGLKDTLKDRADGTVPVLPTRFIGASDSRLQLGGVVFQLEHRNGAHTPGDMMVWLPQKNVLFTGDVTDLATACADTQAYLVALRAHMKKAVDDGVDMSAAVKSFDARPYTRFRNADELMPGNASHAYLEVERE